MKTREYIREIITYLLILLFLYTAVNKGANIGRFYGEINNQPFDNRLTPFLTYGIPAAELLIAALIAWPPTRLKGCYAYTVVMIIFTIYVALITFGYYPRRPCGCAGVIENLSWPGHLVFNCIFTLLGAAAIVFYKDWDLIIKKRLKTFYCNRIRRKLKT